MIETWTSSFFTDEHSGLADRALRRMEAALSPFSSLTAWRAAAMASSQERLRPTEISAGMGFLNRGNGLLGPAGSFPEGKVGLRLAGRRLYPGVRRGFMPGGGSAPRFPDGNLGMALGGRGFGLGLRTAALGLAGCRDGAAADGSLTVSTSSHVGQFDFGTAGEALMLAARSTRMRRIRLVGT